LIFGKGVERMNNYLVSSLIGVCLLSMTLMATSQIDNAPLVINLMVTPDIPASFNETIVDIQESNLRNIYYLVAQENETLTLYLTEDASRQMRAFLGQMGLLSGFEYALSGNNSEEKLSEKSYSDQKSILEKSKKRAEACKICGENEIIIMGFMPPSFNQNEDTYKALEDLNVEYDAGFQAGIIFAHGHEQDVWPYKIEGYDLYAVPISNSEISGSKIPLDDKNASENGLTSSQWYDLLVAKLDDAASKSEPVVISLSTSVSGAGEYLDALRNFINYAQSKDATFVSSYELVTFSRTGDFKVPENASESECTTCNKNGKEINANFTMNNSPSMVNVTME
jgi:hypothetical protein